MGSIGERNELIAEIFKQYDFSLSGELGPEELQQIHMDMRIGSISIPQIQESIKYVCVHNKCEKSELFDLLQEMDRRYFLIQDFRWEFSMLNISRSNTITEEQARWFVQTVHGLYFSNLRWEKFLQSRSVPGSGVTFAEIEVMLCNIPSKADYLADLAAEQREREEWERRQKQLQRQLDDEKARQKKELEAERKRREEEERRRQREEDRRRKEEENERAQRQREKDDAERRRRELEEEEERGRREAEDRERLARERAEQERLQKEMQERERLERLRLEEEERKRKEEEEAGDLEKLYQLAKRKENEAEKEADNHKKRMKDAKDEATRKDAAEAEDRARIRARENRNKKLRYNLKVAIKKRDRDRLVTAVDDFKKAKLPDDDKDLPKADRILREFQARDGLKRAMVQRQIKPLESAINYVKHNGFEVQLSHELIEANKILLQLRRLERIRAEILELKQSTVAEIRSYQKPPPVVHVVMTGTFLLLGHKEKETKDWKTVQALVGKTGKEGLKRRCLGLEPHMVDPHAAARTKVLIGQYELDEIRDVSAGAATFYLWSWTMVEELESQQPAKHFEEEEKKKQAEVKAKAKREEEEAAAQAQQEASLEGPPETPPTKQAEEEPSQEAQEAEPEPNPEVEGSLV